MTGDVPLFIHGPNISPVGLLSGKTSGNQFVGRAEHSADIIRRTTKKSLARPPNHRLGPGAFAPDHPAIRARHRPTAGHACVILIN